MASEPKTNLHVYPKLPSLLATLTIIAVIGIILILISTPLGPGLREDSFSYITAAESLYEGKGLGRWAADGTFRPLTHFPPLLPWLLAGLKKLGLEYVPAARFLNAGLFGVSSLLIGVCTFILTSSRIYAFIGAIVSILSNVLIEIFSWAHSEPLYLALSLVSIISLAYYIGYPARTRYLLVAITTTALSFLTRFAGIAIIGSAALTLLLLPWAKIYKRVKTALLFLLLSSTPTAFFIIKNNILYGTTVDRPTPQWHPPQTAIWLQGAETILGWFLPHRIFAAFTDTAIMLFGMSLLLSTFFGLAFVSFHMYHLFHRTKRPLGPLWFLLLTNMLTYCGLIIVTVLFLDRLTPLNNRILLPTYVFLLLLLLTSAIRYAQNWERRKFQLLLYSGILMFITIHAYRGIQTVRELRVNGLGLSSPQWHSSETMSYLRSLPEVPIYTNDIPAIYFYTNRMAYFIPTQQNPAEGSLRDDYREELISMRSRLQEGNGVLVLFGANHEERLHTAEFEDLIIGLVLDRDYPDSIVYRPVRYE